MVAAAADIERNTTPTYRAPEMIDLHSGKFVGTKVDIWALGCMLYKMAFYRDAFEGANAIHIVSGTYVIPASSPYSRGFHQLFGQYGSVFRIRISVHICSIELVTI